MWATKALIEKVGCENVSLRCEATDVAFVLDSYEDGGEELSAAHACLKEKCSAPVAAAALNPSLKTTSLGFLTADGLEPVDLTATANSLLAQLTDGVQAANAHHRHDELSHVRDKPHRVVPCAPWSHGRYCPLGTRSDVQHSSPCASDAHWLGVLRLAV